MDQVTEILNGIAKAVGGYATLAGIVVGIVVILFLVRWLRRLFGAAPAGPAQERGVKEERLADFPPPPAGKGRLRIEGRPARLRVVVVAPVGKGEPLDADAVEDQLEQIVYGLGAVAKQDKPRIRVWPAQLSNKGFALTFNKMMVRPEGLGKPSRWITIAGQTPPRPRPMMLGLVVQTDEPTSVGHLTPGPEQWTSVVQVT